MTKSYLLVFLIISSSLHACIATRYNLNNVLFNQKKHSTTNPQDYIKKVDHEKTTLSSRVSFLADQVKITRSSSELQADKIIGVIEKRNEDRRTLKEVRTIGKSGADKVDDRLSTVSWKLPKTKKEDPQPGFNLDYAPAHPHPGIHN